ncbi:MAG TPA: hypothetical protein VNZ86_00240, partial [Bacteroidia bacterium]|nr:hypothetical protein [Bacteroidia bacterium]
RRNRIRRSPRTITTIKSLQSLNPNKKEQRNRDCPGFFVYTKCFDPIAIGFAPHDIRNIRSGGVETKEYKKIPPKRDFFIV